MATRKKTPAIESDPYAGMERVSDGGEDLSYLSEVIPMGPEDMKTVLTRVSAMADTLRTAQADFAAATAAAEEKGAILKRIEESEFPDLMKEVGLSEITLSDKSKITLVEDIQCGISEERKPRAFAWLRKNNFDGIIKSQVIVQFEKGQDKSKADLFTALQKDGWSPEAKEAVHPATLKSLLKEQRAKPVLDTDTPAQKEAKQPPADIFGIFPFSKVKLKEAKK